MAKNKNYFKEQKEHSRIKSEFVAAYLPAWAKIIRKKCNKLYYFDVFSGPGIYDDGNKSTPLMIMDAIKDDSWMKEVIQLSFFEGNDKYFCKLKKVIESHEIYSELKYKPNFSNEIIDSKFPEKMEDLIKPGSFTFIDPFGFKDISIELMNIVIEKWGCDCLFYLSISGLERNYNDKDQKESVINFFGKNNLETLENAITKSTLENYQELSEILFSEIVTILKTRVNCKVVKFCVEFDDKERDSHYLVFLSKDKLGAKIMKDIMIKRSLKDSNNLPHMKYSKRKKEKANQLEMLFNSESDMLVKLCKRIVLDFKDKEILVLNLLEECQELSYPYNDANIRKALEQLLENDKLKFVNKSKTNNINKNDIIKITS